jgi:tRNA pseudouridine-54 N-methylase
MRRFLILFNDLPIDRISVKAGQNSPEVVTACRCINVGLFLSGSMRRDVIVTVATGSPEDMRTITFPGETLKRVSPDERSISFFLLKSLISAEAISLNAWRVLDNGIVVAREGLETLISAYHPQNVFLTQKGGEAGLEALCQLEDVLLIYNTGMLIDSIEGLYPTLPYPPHPERFILDINEWLDNKKKET